MENSGKVIVLLLVITGLYYFWSVADSPDVKITHINPVAPAAEPKIVEKAVNKSLSGLTVIAVSPADQAAVMAFGDSDLLTIKTGDELPETNLSVLQITNEKVVLRDAVTGDTYFAYLEAEDGVGRVQKMSNRIMMPTTRPVIPGKQG